MFFVATSPLAAGGHINVSPKGHSSQTFAILNDNKVAFLDLTGSGIETVAHVRENGRIVFMFCSFDDTPCIVRLWGKGTVHEKGTVQFNQLLASAFPAAAAAMPQQQQQQAQPAISAQGNHASEGEQSSTVGDSSHQGTQLDNKHPGFAVGARSIIEVDVTEVNTACGYAVPLYEFKAERDSLVAWSVSKGVEGLEQYRHGKNKMSLDALPGISHAAVMNGASNSSTIVSSSTSRRSKANIMSINGAGRFWLSIDGVRGSWPGVQALVWLGVGVAAGVVLGLLLSGGQL
eukprot:GHRR01005327.1.p1 GENE.GHRR01005327.1~~GHRR01005327.1.p1  ORF type:complete len:289 (+),score=102.69 GHRR01005327.1:318-1184(+)